MGEILKLGVAERVSISCPTCGTRHNITRSVMSAFTACIFLFFFPLLHQETLHGRYYNKYQYVCMRVYALCIHNAYSCNICMAFVFIYIKCVTRDYVEVYHSQLHA